MERATLTQSPDIMEAGVEQGPSPDKSLEAASRLAVLFQNGYVKAVLRQDVATFKSSQTCANHYYLVFFHQPSISVVSFRFCSFILLFLSIRFRTPQPSAIFLWSGIPGFSAAETAAVIPDFHQLPEQERLEGVCNQDGGAHTHQRAHTD